RSRHRTRPPRSATVRHAAQPAYDRIDSLASCKARKLWVIIFQKGVVQMQRGSRNNAKRCKLEIITEIQQRSSLPPYCAILLAVRRLRGSAQQSPGVLGCAILSV